MAEESEKKARGIVARGKTVQVQTGEKKVLGRHPETGDVVYGIKTRDAGPGEEITMPASEIKMLQQLGFLHDPNRVAAPPAEGSHMQEMTS